MKATRSSFTFRSLVSVLTVAGFAIGLLIAGCSSTNSGCGATCEKAGTCQQAKSVGRVFIDRDEPSDLRVVDYNILWNNIFPEISEQNSARFGRVVRALCPDVICIQEIGVTSWMLEENPNARDWTAEDVAAQLNDVAPLAAGGTWHAFRGSDTVIISRFPLTMTRTNTVPPGEREQAIALVDLPDDVYDFDLYVMNNHFKCCGGTDNDPRRQQQSDSIIAWIRDARTPGGEIDLPEDTAVIVCGDLNIVGGFQPVQTLIDGDIVDETTYGDDFSPDADGTAMTDAHPLHNIVGPDDYTWRNDNDKWAPGRLDYIVYSDSVLPAVKKFILDTTLMSDAGLKAAGLQRLDVAVDNEGKEIDHYPLVIDFRP